MKIDIIGSNTVNGIKLRKRVIEIVNELDGKVIINLVDEYQMKELPHLYINGKLFSSGNVPSEKEIVKYLLNELKTL